MPPRTPPANQIQIGGNHYKTSLEHWDFVVLNNLNYLEGNGSKYLSRAEKKAGLQDYQKALHYIQKLREVHAAWQARMGILRHVVRDVLLRNLPWAPAWARRGGPADRLSDFLTYNNVPEVPGQVIEYLSNWKNADDLRAADELLREYIRTRYLP